MLFVDLGGIDGFSFTDMSTAQPPSEVIKIGARSVQILRSTVTQRLPWHESVKAIVEGVAPISIGAKLSVVRHHP